MTKIAAVPTCVLLLATLAPPPAHAQAAEFRNFGIQCYTGAFQACASVTVGIVPSLRTPGASRLIVVLANLQGWPGFGYLDPNVGLEALFIQNLHIENSHDFAYAYSWYGGYTIGNAGGLVQGSANSWDAYFNDLWFEPDIGFTNPLYGCNRPVDDFLGWMQAYTCTGGWHVWEADFGWGAGFGSTIGFTENTNLRFRWDTYDLDGHYARGECVSGETCAVVPEPLTITLLATGLAGLGLLRRRKRADPA